MIVTEEEAKTKRCCGPEGCGSIGRFVPPSLISTMPHGGTFGSGGGFGGPGGSSDSGSGQLRSMCIGSACMAWRWYYEPGQSRYEGVAKSEHGGIGPKWGPPNPEGMGYCGYAGG